MDLQNLSSNWKKLQSTLRKNGTGQKSHVEKHPQSLPTQRGVKRKAYEPPSRHPAPAAINSFASHKKQKTGRRQSRVVENMDVSDQESFPAHLPSAVQQDTDNVRDRSDTINGGLNPSVELGKYVALDCEMVGIGPNPDLESALARISIVNYNGDCVYDSYVRPIELVTDWRTHVSGIAPHHMAAARNLEEVQIQVAALLKDRIVVGHSVRSDFEALLLSHPKKDIRDTARHPPYRKLAGGGSPKLKILASELLGLHIQSGEHSSIEDARATMLLFRRDKDAFEREHAKKWPARTVPTKVDDSKETSKPKKKSKKKRR